MANDDVPAQQNGPLRDASGPPETPGELPRPDQAQQRRIGGFELLQKIGEGGMGTVWKARQISLHRIVALKVLNPEYSKNNEFISRFRNEARAAANLSHPHIIQVYDAGKADDADYLAMEFIEGQSVRAILDAQGPLAETPALDIVIPVAQALQYAWERARLIHRDVKPENILLDRDGTVKLGDLGLARSANTPEDLKITRAGQTLGTPHYIAPEQAQGWRDLDRRCDIYSLGATLYHMVTGHALFDHAPTAAVMLKHLEETVPDAREYQPQLSEGLCMVMERMLAKDRDERYQSWQELLSDLQLVRANRNPVNARVMPGRSTMVRIDLIGPSGLPQERAEAGLLLNVRPEPRLAMTPVTWAALVVLLFCLMGTAVLWQMSAAREGQLRAELAARQLEAQGAAAARAYYEAMEFSRNNPTEYEEIIKRFEKVLHDYSDTEFTPQAAEQVAQWRQRLAVMKQQLARQRALATAAAAARTAGPSPATAKATAAKQAAALAKQRETKRLADEEALRLRQAAQVVYNEFATAWTALLARRDYANAISSAEKAAADPRLLPLKGLLDGHVAAAQRVRAFVEQLVAQDSPLLGKPVALSSLSGTVASVTGKGGLVVEKVPGVGAVVPLLTASSDDLLRLAAAAVRSDRSDEQINYALLLLAEGHPNRARAALEAVPGTEADRFETVASAIIGAQSELEAPAYVADLRAQLAAGQWSAALARMLVIDGRLTNTTAVLAAGPELSAARNQLLSLPPEPATSEASARLIVLAARHAVETADWPRALALVTQLDTRLASGAVPPAVATTLQPDLDDLRSHVAFDSGLPAADELRRREVQRAGGRVWVVLADGSGDVKSLAEAVASAKDGDGIELGPGIHELDQLDATGKRNLLIFGRNGTLPTLVSATSTVAGVAGGFLLRCGDGCRLENLHFQFSARALVQAGTNLTVNSCAFSRPRGARLPGPVLSANCEGDWHTFLQNCLIAAPASDAVFSQPRLDAVTRHRVQFDQSTLWLPDGAVHSTAQPVLKRQDTLVLENCVLFGQQVAAPSWSRALLSSGLVYQGNNNLMFLGRPASDTPAPGDETWKSLYPDRDSASVIRDLTEAMLMAMRNGRLDAALAAFPRMAAGDFRISAASPWRGLADDKGTVGVRWPSWRWSAFLKTAPAMASKSAPLVTVASILPSRSGVCCR